MCAMHEPFSVMRIDKVWLPAPEVSLCASQDSPTQSDRISIADTASGRPPSTRSSLFENTPSGWGRLTTVREGRVSTEELRARMSARNSSEIVTS